MKKGEKAKKTIIKDIQKIIKEHGRFTTADVQAESSPSISQFKGLNQLAEEFDHDKVNAITYDRQDEEIDEEYINYHDLSKEVLEQILALAQDWEVESLQTEKRISN